MLRSPPIGTGRDTRAAQQGKLVSFLLNCESMGGEREGRKKKRSKRGAGQKKISVIEDEERVEKIET